MRNIVLLGSSGSIGESTLRVVEALPGHLRVVALGVDRNYERAFAQAGRFGVRTVAVADDGMARRAAADAPAGMEVLAGAAGIEAIASREDADIVVCAVVGMAGLRPVMAAVERGTDVALATKEVLVAAGKPVSEACARTGARLLPVDSEHSAIFQCLQGSLCHNGGRWRTGDSVNRLLLTASGGPFAGRPEVDLGTVTVRQALAHPRWDMGRKVSIDSATLMNKGLEIIEAHWLFAMPFERIEVLLHPECIVHSIVEFADRSMIAQMSPPDMRFAIQYALTFPERRAGGLPPLDLVKLGPLSFAPVDSNRFPCLNLAREAGTRAGTMPAVLNAANELAVESFLAERIPFAGIWRLVERVMSRHTVEPEPDLAAIMAADAWARAVAREG